MRKSPFIWIGSGRAGRRNVARKGRLLDQAARSGLPVPSGGILLDDFYRICLIEGLVRLADNAITIPDPVWLHEVLIRDIRFPRMDKPVAVRPAIGLAVDEIHATMRARLNVDLGDPLQLADALSAVWSTIHNDKEEQAHDILIMEMVIVEVAGEALTVAENQQDQVQLTLANDDKSSTVFKLEKIGTFQRASSDVPLYARRLQKLLRGIRRSFGKGGWRIEWADDGEICWVLQVELPPQ
jgi:hypothetical protein